METFMLQILIMLEMSNNVLNSYTVIDYKKGQQSRISVVFALCVNY